VYRLFVLGAGFSRPAGLPLGNELFSLVLAEAARDREPSFAELLRDEAQRYRLYTERTTGRVLKTDELELEQFMSFLDTEHALGFTGGETFSDQGNKAQLLIRYLIAKVLYRLQRRMSADARNLYDDFASHLDPGDWILTFNYDTIVEEALERAKKPFRLMPARYKAVDEWGATYADDDSDVVVLKMHGSIDWFKKDHYKRNLRYRRRAGLADRPRDAVFNNPPVKPEALVRGSYWRTSHLRNVYRARNLSAYFEQAIPLLDPPFLISPSYSKALYLPQLGDFWRDIDSIGSTNGTLAIIGYSLPAYDEYVRQALYAAVRNFQHHDTGDLVPKTKLKLVDYQQTPKGQDLYRATYRFVDWARAETHFEGFSSDAIRMLFAA
jgi:hypothetical protein